MGASHKDSNLDLYTCGRMHKQSGLVCINNTYIDTQRKINYSLTIKNNQKNPKHELKMIQEEDEIFSLKINQFFILKLFPFEAQLWLQLSISMTKTKEDSSKLANTSLDQAKWSNCFWLFQIQRGGS